MAEVKEYSPQISPSGQLTSRADANNFGLGVGRALENVGQSQFALAEGQQALGAGFSRAGNALNDVAQQLYLRETQDEVTKVHQWMANSRVNWQQKLTDLENATDPGDKTFVNRVQDVMKADYDAFKKSLTTRGANERADVMYSDMRAMFGGEAVSIQSRLAGANIVNQNADIVTKLSGVAGNAPEQLDSALQQLKVAIYDPASNYAHAPGPTRDRLYAEGAEKIKFAAAQSYVRRNPAAVLENLDSKVHEDVLNAVSNSPRPGLPPNLGAEGLPPLTKDQLSGYANKIDAPSPYDADFKAAGARYGVDWRELKMRSVVESGLRNLSPNSAGAMGVMQITGATAKDWGIDAMNPNQSIMAAARNLAKYQLRAQGDMSKVDMMYHGGPDGEGTANWGPKTRQYAANMAALRQTAGIISTSNPESFANGQSPLDVTHQNAVQKSLGDKVPGFSELPWNMQATLVVNAEHYQRAAQAQATRAQAERARIDKDVQESTLNDMLRRVLDPQTFGNAPTESEIAGAGLEPSQVTTLIGFMHQREANRTRADKDHPEAMVSMIQSIEAPPGDPTRINSVQDLIDVYTDGKISEAELMRLEARLAKRQEGGTTLTKKLSSAFQLAHSVFKDSTVDAYAAADFTNRWSSAVETMITAEQNAGRDPMDLFNPKNKNYVLSKEFINSFTDPPELQLANGAKRVTQAAESTASTGAGLQIGDVRKGWTYIGGDPGNPKSWKK